MRRSFIVGGIVAAVGVALGAVLAGCVIVAGNSDSYHGPPAEAGIECFKAADCNGGEAGTLSCCGALDENKNPTAKCSPASCASPSLQLCGGEHDCQDAGTCTPHTCTFGKQTLTISSCGQSPCP